MTLPETAHEVAPPSVKLDKILAKAAAHRGFFAPRRGQVLTSNLAALWAQEITYAEKGSDAFGDNLRYTLLQYVGQAIDDAFIHLLSRQIAARQKELRFHMLVAYTKPLAPEWVAMEVASLRPAAWRGDKPGVELVLEALTGHPAGHQLRHKVPRSWLSFLAYRVGFTKRMQYDDEPRLFVGLRFFGYLKPQPDSSELSFDEWHISARLKAHNTTIIRLRTRFEHDVDCPNGFDHDCWACPKRISECPASYHR